MKRRVLSKTTLFHVKKKKKDQNGVILNDIVPLSSSPGCVAGEERKVFCFFFFNFTASLSFRVLCQDPKSHALWWWGTRGAAPIGQPTGAALLPMRNNNEPLSFGSINRGSTPTQRGDEPKGGEKRWKKKWPKREERNKERKERLRGSLKPRGKLKKKTKTKQNREEKGTTAGKRNRERKKREN